MYAFFKSLDDFTLWHNKVCEDLGIPDGKGTFSYTNPITKKDDNGVIALVDGQIDISNLSILTNEEVENGDWLPKLSV